MGSLQTFLGVLPELDYFIGSILEPCLWQIFNSAKFLAPDLGIETEKALLGSIRDPRGAIITVQKPSNRFISRVATQKAIF